MDDSLTRVNSPHVAAALNRMNAAYRLIQHAVTDDNPGDLEDAAADLLRIAARILEEG